MEILFKISATIILTAIAAWSYRFGGSSHGMRFIREIGVGISEILVLTIWYGWNWWALLIMGTVWGLTTYFKAKGTDAKWWNWLLVGIVAACIPLPYVIANGHMWAGFAWRSIFIIPFITLFCTLIGGNVQYSEGVRGGIQIFTIPMLMIKKFIFWH